MKVLTSQAVAALALFVSSAVAAPSPATIGHWTGALEVSIGKRTAAPEPPYDLSAWTGSHHVSIEGREYDLSGWTGAKEVSIEGREAEAA